MIVIMAQTSRPTFRPSKQTDRHILENSMPEDDPNGNCDSGPRWGPNHKGAQELQRLYTKGIINIFFYLFFYLFY